MIESDGAESKSEMKFRRHKINPARARCLRVIPPARLTLELSLTAFSQFF